MTRINGLGGPTSPTRTGSGRPAAGSSFVVPDSTEAGAAAESSAMTGVSTVASLDAMLALQEVQGDTVIDRQARRHGHSMLRLLTKLQVAQLDGTVDIDSLQGLADLADSMPQAADPTLAAVLRSVALRARVELARAALVHKPAG